MNSAMQEVVRAEVIKWVSLIHVVPKKAGVMVVKNKDNELVPTRV